MLGPTDGMYTNCWGFGIFDGSSWKYHRSFDFCDVNSLYAVRDAVTNRLEAWTVGAQNFSNGERAWRFNGTDFGSKCVTVLADPSDGTFICGGILAGNGSYGFATAVWGSGPNDVYVTGKLGYPTAAGRVYRFDGGSWVDMTPQLSAVVGETLPVATTITGTGKDDVWIALQSGRILRYAVDR